MNNGQIIEINKFYHPVPDHLNNYVPEFFHKDDGKMSTKNDKRPPLTQRQANDCEIILEKIAESAMKKILKQKDKHYSIRAFHSAIEDIFKRTTKIQTDKIIEAVKNKSDGEKLLNSQKEKRKKARQELASELRNARAKLKSIKWESFHAEEVAKKKVEEHARENRKYWAKRLHSAADKLKKIRTAYIKYSENYAKLAKENIYQNDRKTPYPEIPPPHLIPQDGIPEASGIYFLWKENTIEYVGKSINLFSRLKLGSHHVLNESHKISFVFVDKKELNWAECYYIGICKPTSNFGADFDK